jgi:segregation and condensation protein B
MHDDDDDDDNAPGSAPTNLFVLPGLGGPPVAADDDSGVEPPSDGPPSAEDLPFAIEAMLLAADGPVTTTELDGWLCAPGTREVGQALHELRRRLTLEGAGMRLVEVAKGWQLRTDPRFARFVAAMRGGRPVKLSRAALETLSIVSYRQPVSRTEVEDLRGVDSGGVLRMLTERNLVTVCGRLDEPGRPLLYGTTNEFLSLFGMRDLSDLPTLRDLRDLRRDDDRDGLGGTDDPPSGEPVSDADDVWLRPNQQPLPIPLRRPGTPTFGFDPGDAD